ncbi:unnamed protein product [Albugo candida]|uniref:Uncharacterized protein n=1 Tax=Albugo candida TaxID=65357 RepID=A0A024GFL9_9STRA|nr:unnamed protein product [Albugo candida]|eukprot:CCI45477.1 unnamed protein product [Albugo candida]
MRTRESVEEQRLWKDRRNTLIIQASVSTRQGNNRYPNVLYGITLQRMKAANTKSSSQLSDNSCTPRALLSYRISNHRAETFACIVDLVFSLLIFNAIYQTFMLFGHLSMTAD